MNAKGKQMHTCIKCKSKMGGHARYCTNCGTKREGKISPYGRSKRLIHGWGDKVLGEGMGHTMLQIFRAKNKLKITEAGLPPAMFCPECGEHIPELPKKYSDLLRKERP